MTNILMEEVYVNITENCGYGESGIYESFTSNKGKLFRSCQKEYGRCKGFMYINDGDKIGWVFEKLAHYEDTEESYLQETWIILHSKQPKVTKKFYYIKL